MQSGLLENYTEFPYREASFLRGSAVLLLGWKWHHRDPNMTILSGRLVILAAVVVVAIVRPAMAQTPVEAHTVRAGQSVALATGSTAPIAVTTDAKRGKTSISETATAPKQFTLLYTAPQTDAAFTESVVFTNPTSHSVDVTVVPGDGAVYQQAFKSLFVLFVLALLLESGLAVIFRWRPFLVYFDGRGVKTVVSVVFALLFVWSFDMDIVTDLVNVYSQRATPFKHGFEGFVVTALIVAGGSAAVNSIFVALGFRSVVTHADIAPKPPRTEGWISVTLLRKGAIGPVDVLIGAPPAVPATRSPIAGTIIGGTRLTKFVRLFLRDAGRFPMSGGYAVPAGSLCQVHLRGVDQSGKAVESRVWGPETIAPGAIIDIELEL